LCVQDLFVCLSRPGRQEYRHTMCGCQKGILLQSIFEHKIPYAIVIGRLIAQRGWRSAARDVEFMRWHLFACTCMILSCYLCFAAGQLPLAGSLRIVIKYSEVSWLMSLKNSLVISILAFSVSCGTCSVTRGADEAVMTGTGSSTQGLQVINTDIGSFILNNNPVCPEADRKLTGSHRILSSSPDCGRQVKLQTWTCTSTGEDGWQQEVYDLKPCY